MKPITEAKPALDETAGCCHQAPLAAIYPAVSRENRPQIASVDHPDAGPFCEVVEDPLKESQAWLNALFEGVETGIFIIDPGTHTLVNANAVAAEMVGLPREKIVGSLCHKFVCPAEKGRCPVTDLGQSVDNSERVLLTANGERRAIIKTVRSVEVAGRRRLLESFVDITELKRVEASLRESEDRFRTAFEDAPYGMCMTAPNGRFMHANAALCAILGYTEQELLAGAWQQITHPEDLARSLQAAVELKRPGAAAVDLEKRYIHKNGSIVWTRLKISPANRTPNGASHFITQIEDITLRRQADEAKAFLASLIESSQDAIIGTAVDGTVVSWNPGATELFGYAAEEVIGNSISVLMPQGLDVELLELRERISRGERMSRYETIRIRKDGTPVNVELTLSPVWDVDGKFTGVASITHDISARKRRQEELSFKTTLLETEAETSIDGILVVDRAGHLLQSNRRFAEIFNFPETLLSRQDTGLLLNQLKPLVQDPAAFMERIEYLNTHQSEEARDEVLFKDGRCIDRYTAPLKNTQGGYYGRIWYFRDITDRKQVEQALRENEERYRELFENASEIIFTTDLEGRFTSINRAGQHTFGYSQEADKTDIWRLVTPDSWQVLKNRRAAMLAGETKVTSEIELTARNGQSVKLEIKPRLIRRGGEPVGIQVIARDITGRDLAELELRQAQKLESVGRLASGIAHEINTPIQFVGDNAQFLQDSFKSLKNFFGKMCQLRDAVSAGAVGPELLNAVRRAEDESDCAYLLEEIPRAIAQTLEGVDRVATIVRAMKEFAHPEDKGLAPADLNKALMSTMTVARNEWKYVAEIESDFGEIPLVVCNVGDLNQVFLNLFVNAAHAIADRVKDGAKGHIVVRTALEANMVHISISDSGSGIPENIRSKIFDPFFTTKEVGRGTGQGLAIARSVVVERHKGTLTFDSEVGKGTTFHVRLPLEPEQTATDNHR